jgi:hypothetical protein
MSEGTTKNYHFLSMFNHLFSKVPKKAHRNDRFFDKNTEIKEVMIRNTHIEPIPLLGGGLKSVDRRLTVGSPSGMTR